MTKLDCTISGRDAGERIDIVASRLSGITRSRVRHMIEDGTLTVNGRVPKPNYRAQPGDALLIASIEDAESSLVPEDIPLPILYRDDHLVVVDKPAGMVVYPAAGHNTGTLMNALAHRCGPLKAVGGPLRPGVVHRLDKDTSGVMVVALDDRAYYDLVEQFRERTISRRYRALVFGTLKTNSGKIALPIGRSPSDRKKMSTVSRRGKEAVTTWKTIELFKSATLIEARLGTGRTHQIRVHFSSIGHPVLGDRTYGKKTSFASGGKVIPVGRQMLHAESLGFLHPVSRKQLEFASPLPGDMESILALLRHEAAGFARRSP